MLTNIDLSTEIYSESITFTLYILSHFMVRHFYCLFFFKFLFVKDRLVFLDIYDLSIKIN